MPDAVISKWRRVCHLPGGEPAESFPLHVQFLEFKWIAAEAREDLNRFDISQDSLKRILQILFGRS